MGPVPVTEPFAAITANGHTTCALTVSGRAFCWGRGTDGQLGNGGESNQIAPVPVKGGLVFTSLSAGHYHTCGLTYQGVAYCWGAKGENSGQLGNGPQSRSSREPVRVRISLRFVQIAAGQMHTCGLTAEGEAYCWGDNYWGQLGDGTTRNRSTPVSVAEDHRFAWLGTGAIHTCGATVEGGVFCWGDNFFGAVTGSPLMHTPDTCADGYDMRCTLRPYRLEIDQPLRVVAGGDGSTCGLSDSGEWYCWGGNMHEPSPPRLVESEPSLKAVSVGSSHSCAIADGGAAYCWGGNNIGQLGTGEETEFYRDPMPVTGKLIFQSIAAGMFHTCGVTMDGVAYCWGGNRDLQLGHGATHTCWGSYPCSRYPVRVRGQQ